MIISHPDPIHMGALPYLVGRAGLQVPIYATGAVHKMGQMFLYDTYLTRHACSDFDVFDLDDIDAAFAGMTPLRFRQESALTGKGDGITVTPFPAGRLVGGAIWRISYKGEDFVYALDFNHRRERHLVGAPLEASFLRPAVFISDAFAFGKPPADRNTVERMLIDKCMATLRDDGNVLIPVDTAGRVFELLLVLEKYWSEHKLTYPLVFVGPMTLTTLDFARSSLEWMNETLVKSFGHSRDNPFNFRYLKALNSLAEMKKLPFGPKVVLATDASMEAGPSRQLFAEWGSDPRNLIVVSKEPLKGTLCGNITNICLDETKTNNAPFINLILGKRVPLKGEELEAHIREEESKAQKARDAAVDKAKITLLEPESHEGKDGNVIEEVSKPTRTSTAQIGHLSHHAADRVAEMNMKDGGDIFVPLEESTGNLDLDIAGNCLVEGFEIPEGAIEPIFPAEDSWEEVKYDEYGAIAEFEGEEEGGVAGGRLGRKLASEAAAEQSLFAKGGDAEMLNAKDDESRALNGALDEDAAMIPTKIDRQEINLQVLAKVLRIEFDGRSDGKSVQTILSHIAPRTTILVHATLEAASGLASRLETELEGLHANVYSPAPFETINVHTGPSFKTEISDKLWEVMEMHSVGGYDLAWIDGVLEFPKEKTEQDEKEDEKTENNYGIANSSIEGKSEEKIPILKIRESTNDLEASNLLNSYGGVFIGDVRLSELRKALSAQGIESDFYGGALYCAGQVVVRRRGEGGGLVLEGAGCELFYKVREIIYGQYHIA